MRFVVGWTVLCAVGLIVAASVWAENEESCDLSTSFICFEEGEIWLATGLFGGIVWLAGLAIAALVRGLAARDRDPPAGR